MNLKKIFLIFVCTIPVIAFAHHGHINHYPADSLAGMYSKNYSIGKDDMRIISNNLDIAHINSNKVNGNVTGVMSKPESRRYGYYIRLDRPSKYYREATTPKPSSNTSTTAAPAASSTPSTSGSTTAASTASTSGSTTAASTAATTTPP